MLLHADDLSRETQGPVNILFTTSAKQCGYRHVCGTYLSSNICNDLVTLDAMFPHGLRWGMRSRNAISSIDFCNDATFALKAGMDLSGRANIRVSWVLL